MFSSAAPLALLLGLVGAAAVAPVPEANVTDRLEALVSEMADKQRDVASAPAPKPLDEDNMMLVEGGDRRRLGACNCNGGYRNGASSGSPVCSKKESSKNVCYPTMHSGACAESAMTLCGSRGPAASPGPVLFDAEEFSQDAYLNVMLQIYDPQNSNAVQLPTADAFAAALAQLTATSANRVSVLTTWGTPSTGVRSTQSVAQQAAGANALHTATVHATIGAQNAERRDALISLLRLSDELPEMNGRTFRVSGLEVFEETGHPLVFPQQDGAHNADAVNLLNQLVELKRQEVELMRQGVAAAAQHPGTSAELLQKIAVRLNVQIQ